MKKFRTSYSSKKSPKEIETSSALFLMGSCFSTSIFEYLSYRKFKVCSNPYGILFNPSSIFKALEEIIALKSYKTSDLVENQSVYHSLNHHSSFSRTQEEEVLGAINSSIQNAHSALQKADFLFLTLGTAWVYEKDAEVVANCHKIPHTNFQKRLLSVPEIEANANEVIQKLKQFNTDLHIVFTLSPVRHLKNGMEENHLSKAILRTAIHQIQEGNASISYFPAAEIVLDDLRDYRFYKSDMLHPNEDAISYVWEHFSTTYFSSKTQDKIKRIEKLQAAIAHRPVFENSKAHQKHLEFIEKEKKALGFYSRGDYSHHVSKTGLKKP